MRIGFRVGAICAVALAGSLTRGSQLQGEAGQAGREMAKREQFRKTTRSLRIESKSDPILTPEVQERITGEVKAVLTQEIIETLNRSGPNASAVRKAFQDLDGSLVEPNPEYSEAPYAFRSALYSEPVLVTGVLLRRGGTNTPQSRSIIQAFSKDSAGHWRVAAETGEDLDGYALNMRELPSPRAGEIWFLAYGNLTGFNGRKIRMRIFSFDGKAFQTVWQPQDRLSAEITVEDRVLTVRYLDGVRWYQVRKPPYSRIEKFALTARGVEELAAYWVED